MTHGSLFSGIGGFDLAAEWMGWENKFHCEWNPFGQKVLHYYWPNAEQFTDITKSDFTKYANKIDILTGGFPCQPYSSAGKRLGKEDERHLWPQMLRAIREIKPRWVVGENVYGLVNWSGGLVFHEVQADLEAEGYEVQPYLLPAVSVNAPHRRDRIWFVAYANNDGGQKQGRYMGQKNGKLQREGNDIVFDAIKYNGNERSSPNPNNTRTDIGMPSEREWQKSDGIGGFAQRDSQQSNGDGDAADTDFVSNNHKPNSRGNGEIIESRRQEDKRVFTGVINRRDSKDNDATNTMQVRLQQCEDRGEVGGGQSEVCGTGRESANGTEANGEVRDAADTNDKMLESRNGQGETGGRADEEVRTEPFDKPRDWATFPSVSPVCVRNDGFSDRLDGITFPKWRNESIKAGGNAVVPQVVYQIFKAIEQYDNNV